jgi:hypothetical protein
MRRDALTLAAFFGLCGPAFGQALQAPSNLADVPNASTALANLGGLPITGGTMTGALTLAANPTSALQAATKQYVDNNYIPIVGTTQFLGLLSSTSTGSTAPPSTNNIVTFDALGNTFNFQRELTSGGYPYAGVRSYLTNNDPTFGTNGVASAFMGQATSTAASRGSSAAVYANLISNSQGGYQYADIAFDSNVVKTGSIWTWGLAHQTQDNSGIAPLGNTYGSEWDILANGPDVAASLYSPNSSNRIFMLLASKNNPTGTYASNSAVATGALVSAIPVGGVLTVFVAQNAGTTGGQQIAATFTNGSASIAGTNTLIAGQLVQLSGSPPAPFTINTQYYVQTSGLSGTAFQLNTTAGASGLVVTGSTGTAVANTPPTWNGTAGSTVTDGTVTWLTGTTFASTVGTGIEFGGVAGYNTLIASTATVNNAFLDFSAATLASGVNAAAIRLAANQFIDFTGNNTAGGKNARILGYSGTDGGVEFIISGAVSTRWRNDGGFQEQGILWGGAAASMASLTSFSATGWELGISLNSDAYVDFIGNQYGTQFYHTNSSGVVTPGSYDFQLKSSGEVDAPGVNVLASGSTATLSGTTGYSASGLTFGRQIELNGDNDITFNATGGLWFFGVNNSGVRSTTEAMTIFGNGNVQISGHQISVQGTAPTVAQSGGTGSTTLNAQATDAKGTATEGTAATGFVVTFQSAYATAPDCVVTSPTGSALTSYTPATGTLTVVNAALTGAKFTYHCIQ